MRSSSYLILALLSGAFHAAGASASVGSSSLGTLADTSRVVDLDEVVVVSQPKENFRLRRQPVAATVFTDSMMQGLGISSLSRLSAFVPSFAVPDYGARYTSSIYVRGIGSRIGDPAVGMYVDNVPLVNKSTYNRHLYMIDALPHIFPCVYKIKSMLIVISLHLSLPEQPIEGCLSHAYSIIR